VTEPVLAAVSLEQARELVDAMVAEMSARYGGDGASPIDGTEFEPPYGVFLLATVDGTPVASGGLRHLHGTTGEIKRMYADPAHRGRGHARRLLRALVDHARQVGLEEVWLETGTKQPEAIALYESEGFRPIAAYGYYKDEPLSRCYGLQLSP
jgi:GNAT superfamily N-acetyltransferase